jgi:hypothetical protein
MVFIHFVLIYGTNNVDTVGHTYTDQQLYQRSMGARMVLGARIFYAMYSTSMPDKNIDQLSGSDNVRSLDHEAHCLRVSEANNHPNMAPKL